MKVVSIAVATLVSLGVMVLVITWASTSPPPTILWELWRFNVKIGEGQSMTWWEHWPTETFTTGRACILALPAAYPASCIIPGRGGASDGQVMHDEMRQYWYTITYQQAMQAYTHIPTKHSPGATP